MTSVFRRPIQAPASSVLLVPMLLLLGISLWLQPTELHRGRDSAVFMLGGAGFAVRQGLAGFVAVTLALGIGRFLPSQTAVRHAWAPTLPLVLILLAAPLSAWVGWSLPVRGTFWWERSVGLAAMLLALLGGLGWALPRLDRFTVHGAVAFVVAVGVGAVLPHTLMRGQAGTLLTCLGVFGLAVASVVRGLRCALAMSVTVAVFAGSLLVMVRARWPSPAAFLAFRTEADSQGSLSLLSIHSGGWTGQVRPVMSTPEWQTDFMFGQLCAVGGVVGGAVAVAAAGVLLIGAWRIVGRCQAAEQRAWAASAAASLTVPLLLHIAANLALLPALPFHFPFLSYAPTLVVLDGVFLGVLIALDRDQRASPIPSRRLRLPRLIGAGVGLLLALSVGRVVWIVQHPPVRAEGQKTERERTQRSPPRGTIYDAKGTALARPGVRHAIVADPSRMGATVSPGELAELAGAIGLEAEGIVARTTDRSRRYMVLKPDASADAVATVRRLALDWVSVELQPARSYPPDPPLAHLVGFVRYDRGIVGGGGVEYDRNSWLAAGGDIRLTLDIDLQSAVQAVANAAVCRTRAAQAQILVLNPTTGALLAAAQCPAANGAENGTAPMAALTWRSSLDVYEPGGAIRPLVIASALDGGVIELDTVIDCENGTWTYCDQRVNDAVPCGVSTVADILVASSNIGTAKIGLRMGNERLYERLVGWGVDTACAAGFGVGCGSLRNPSRWSAVEAAWIPMGYGVALSSLQVARAYTAFFNDGHVVEPCLVAAERPKGGDWLPRAPVPPRRVVSPAIARQVRGLLVRAVEEGTGQAARIEGCSVFGKTSVVQKTLPSGGGYDADRVQTGFVGGFDSDGTSFLIISWLDEPERLCNDNPSVGVFRDVARILVGR